MRRVSRPSRGIGTFLVLSVLFVFGFADSAGDHEPRSTTTGSVPRLDGSKASSSPTIKTHHQNHLAGAALGPNQRSTDALSNRGPIGIWQPFFDLAQFDFAENGRPNWNAGAAAGMSESLPSSFDGLRFNLTTWLSGTVEVVLPFGQDAAEVNDQGGLDEDFRVFGSVTMKF